MIPILNYKIPWLGVMKLDDSNIFSNCIIFFVNLQATVLGFCSSYLSYIADWEVHANIISSMVGYMLNAKLNISVF